MRLRTIRGLAAVALATVAVTALSVTPALAQQTGDAFIVFDVDTGELRMNPGSATATSSGVGGITGYTVDVNSELSLSWNSTAVFPSGSYPFPPTNTASRIGAAFYTLSTPNVSPGGNQLGTNNLQLSTANVVASTTPGFIGTPEWSFGNVGPTNLTTADALTALGATTQGGLASGNRFFTMQGVIGNQQFAVYTVSAVPEPSTMMLAAGGIATLGVAGWRRRLRKDASGSIAA
jgi:hypothetical protein